MSDRKGFSLIEIIVAVAVIAILAGALAPVVINRIEQARYQRIAADLQAIYEAAMGRPQENYFGYVGDVGALPDSVRQLMDGTGSGSAWNGPYLFGGSANPTDIYGQGYVIDKNPIRARSFGPNRLDEGGGGDDIVFPENPVGTFMGGLDVQVFINGMVITDAATWQVYARLSYSEAGEPSLLDLTYLPAAMIFRADSVHQGVHVLTVNANLAVEDPATVHRQLVTVYPGSRASVTVHLQDADYPTIPGTSGGLGTAPVVNAVTPSYGYQGDINLLVTIDGAYFQSGATVAFSGAGITALDVPAVFIGATQLTTRINIDGAAGTGYRDVTVTNPAGLSGTGSSIFEVLAEGGSPGPSINAVTPNAVAQGSTGMLITITGQNFQAGSVVTFSNPGISITNTAFVSGSQLNVTINVSSGAAIATGTVRVTNPDNKMAESAFTVTAVKPVITQIDPNNLNHSTNNRWVQLYGSDFINGITATTSGSPLSINQVQWQSSTQMRVRVSTGFTLYGVDRLIIVTNPGGAADSVTFHINGVL